MFESLGSFSVAYFSLSAVLFLLILFEKLYYFVVTVMFELRY